MKSLSKRQLFILATGVLWLGFFSIRFSVPVGIVYVYALFAVLSTAFILREELAGFRHVTALLLPVSLALATGLVLISLPTTSPLWYLIWAAFLPLYYTTLLSVNIFAVAAAQEDRVVPLVRAASTAAFVTSIATSFLFFSYIYNNDYSLLVQLLSVFFVATLLSFHYLWSLSRQTLPVVPSFFIGFLLTQVAIVISFYPLAFAPRALLLSTAVYVLLGVARQQVTQVLKMRVVLEFAFVMAVVVSIVSLLG